MNDKTYLPYSETCFVCGESNDAGLQTRFYLEDGLVKTRIEARPHHCGYAGVVHGGIVAAVLDECMGWAAAHAIQRMCFTAELTVRYKRNAPDDRPLVAETRAEKAHRRMVETSGRLVDADGTEYATARGKFMPMSPEETLRVDDYLIYADGGARIFDGLREDRSS